MFAPVGTRKRVLVVDDELAARVLAEGLLRKLGHEVISCAQATDAASLAEKHRPDLVLLDVLMPGLDGAGVARALAARPGTASIPVVFLTSIISSREEGKRDQKGSRFLAKPVDRNKLAAVLYQVFGTAA